MRDDFYEWDDGKAQANFRKHGVSFMEAVTVFDDPYAVLEEDREHSIEESRTFAIGFSITEKVLLVVYAERLERTRIISARRATHAERRRYESQFR